MSSILLASCSEAIEEREVDEGDWRGLSKGEAEIELVAEDSVAGLRLSATRLGSAVDDMLGVLRLMVFNAEVTVGILPRYPVL